MSVRLRSIGYNAIQFDAVLKNGVPTVPQEMVDLANKIALRLECQIVGFTGDFDSVSFEIVPDLTHDEAERAMKEFGS